MENSGVLYGICGRPKVELFIEDETSDRISFEFTMERKGKINDGEERYETVTFTYGFKSGWVVENYKPCKELPGADISDYLLKLCKCADVPFGWLVRTFVDLNDAFDPFEFYVSYPLATVIGRITTKMYELHKDEDDGINPYGNRAYSSMDFANNLHEALIADYVEDGDDYNEEVSED